MIENEKYIEQHNINKNPILFRENIGRLMKMEEKGKYSTKYYKEYKKSVDIMRKEVKRHNQGKTQDLKSFQQTARNRKMK